MQKQVLIDNVGHTSVVDILFVFRCSWGFPGWTAFQYNCQALQLGHSLLGS